MKANLFKGKSKRTQILTVITIASIVILLGLNLILSYVCQQNTVFFDMTLEGLYTLSDAMKEECDQIFDELSEKGDQKIKITFCTDPDYLTSSSFARLTYFMSLQIRNRYSDMVDVETVNVKFNPTAVAQYKTTSLSKIDANNVIVSYGDRYRITTIDNFWVMGTSNTYHYNGEYRIASLIKSVTALGQPSAYFVTDHGETYYDTENPESEMSKSMAAFADLLRERGLAIKTLNLSEADGVPEDCALLIINNPTSDFTYDKDRLDEFSYVSDTEKIDRYLVMKQGAVMVMKDYQKKLPVFENFLYEWGFKFSNSVVVDREASLEDKDNTATNIIAQYDTNTESYGYALYGEYADLTSAPLTIFSNTGSVECSFTDTVSSSEPGCIYAYKEYASFLTSSETAKRYMRDSVTGEVSSVLDGIAQKYDLAAVTVRGETNPDTNENKYSYLFCVNSPDFLSNDLLGEPSYANYDILSAVIDNISRIDEHASIDLGGLSLNSSSGGGKRLISSEMSTEDTSVYSNKDKTGLVVIKENHGISNAEIAIYTSFVVAVPVAVLIVGIVVCAKRKYL